MPEPFNKWATDHFVYNYITKPLAKNMCFVHPNTITLAAALCTIPVVINILKNGSRLALVFWMVFRAFLDCLDGSVARACRKVTEMGAFFDVLGDTCYILGIAVSISYVVFKRKLFGIAQWVVGFSVIVGGILGLYEVLLEATGNNKKRFGNPIVRIAHDNTILVNFLGAILINSLAKTPLGRPI